MGNEKKETDKEIAYEKVEEVLGGQQPVEVQPQADEKTERDIAMDKFDDMNDATMNEARAYAQSHRITDRNRQADIALLYKQHYDRLERFRGMFERVNSMPAEKEEDFIAFRAEASIVLRATGKEMKAVREEIGNTELEPLNNMLYEIPDMRLRNKLARETHKELLGGYASLKFRSGCEKPLLNERELKAVRFHFENAYGVWPELTYFEAMKKRKEYSDEYLKQLKNDVEEKKGLKYETSFDLDELKKARPFEGFEKRDGMDWQELFMLAFHEPRTGVFAYLGKDEAAILIADSNLNKNFTKKDGKYFYGNIDLKFGIKPEKAAVEDVCALRDAISNSGTKSAERRLSNEDFRKEFGTVLAGSIRALDERTQFMRSSAEYRAVQSTMKQLADSLEKNTVGFRYEAALNKALTEVNRYLMKKGDADGKKNEFKNDYEKRRVMEMRRLKVRLNYMKNAAFENIHSTEYRKNQMTGAGYLYTFDDLRSELDEREIDEKNVEKELFSNGEKERQKVVFKVEEKISPNAPDYGGYMRACREINMNAICEDIEKNGFKKLNFGHYLQMKDPNYLKQKKYLNRNEYYGQVIDRNAGMMDQLDLIDEMRYGGTKLEFVQYVKGQQIVEQVFKEMEELRKDTSKDLGEEIKKLENKIRVAQGMNLNLHNMIDSPFAEDMISPELRDLTVKALQKEKEYAENLEFHESYGGPTKDSPSGNRTIAMEELTK